MTNKRIPDLTAATTPLAGTELVPVWDGTTDTLDVRLIHNQGGAVLLDTAPTGNYIDIFRVA